MTYERPKITTYKVGDVRKYAQLKRDGIMLTLEAKDNKVRALTRHPDGAHDISAQLIGQGDFDAFRRSDLSDDPVLFCELFVPNEPASQVKSKLADGAVEDLFIESFAVPYTDEDLGLDGLATNLDFGISQMTWIPWPDCGGDDYASMSEVFAWFRNWQHHDGGYEGFVLKDGNMLNWCKWKPVLTADLVVLGFKDGQGKYLGTLGSLQLGLHDGTFICNCSGMDDTTRDYISENEDKILGSVVEVSYQRRDSGGGLRHPRFARFRDDKTREECVEI